MGDPPRAPARPERLVHHVRERIDPYYWLRAENWQEVMRDPAVLDPEIRAYLEAENAYCAAQLADTEALQKKLFDEMRARMKEDDSSVPVPDGPYSYYWRFETGGQHEIYCRRPRDSEAGAEEVLLHGDREAQGHSYFEVANFVHSPDHRYAAYAVDLNGSEFHTVRIRNLASGEDLPDQIEDANGDIAWAADSRTFLYTKLDAHHRPARVFLHRLGNDPKLDRVVYDEPDPAYFVSVDTSLSQRFIFISSHDHGTSEIRFVSTDAPEAEPMLVAAREQDHQYSLNDHDDHFLILTNCDGAEDFKVMSAPIGAPTRANWTDWLAHKPGRLILSMTAYKNFLVRLERQDALPRLVVTTLERNSIRGSEHAIAFAEPAYSLSMSDGAEYDTSSLRFTYSSPARPLETFDYDMGARSRNLRKRQEVPSGHDPEAYRVTRLDAPAHDGEMIPVTLLHRADFKPGDGAPLFLYGYGAYGISIPPSFSASRLSLVDRGFVFAIAHVRGGKDKGFAWYRDGRRTKKRNTFEDFVSVARHLIASGYTRKGEIVAHGGSAGGLLMGAVANMAPELFKAVIAEVAFVDTLTTILDASLPLTPPEWTEWGNPVVDRDVYDYMASYSPYDNVEVKAYPHILALAGLTDPRVTYWEPAKWVAKLRARKTDQNMTLLRVNMDAGHGGASGRFGRLEEIALVYAFALRRTGLASPSRP